VLNFLPLAQERLVLLILDTTYVTASAAFQLPLITRSAQSDDEDRWTFAATRQFRNFGERYFFWGAPFGPGTSHSIASKQRQLAYALIVKINLFCRSRFLASDAQHWFKNSNFSWTSNTEIDSFQVTQGAAKEIFVNLSPKELCQASTKI
jgi:hypothetical protein